MTTTTQPTTLTRVVLSKARRHPEGYAVDLYSRETKLATTYGGSVEEAAWRATKVAYCLEENS
jgi:dsRNA-specific ribonuclease